MIDPFGLILATIRGNAGVQAIASTRVSSEAPSTLPAVWLKDGPTSRRPFGPTSGNLGLQWWSGFAECYAADTPTGAITARSLAGAVSDALHGHGWIRDATSRYMLRSYAPDIEAIERDPDTRWPFYTVRIEAYLAAEAVPLPD